MGVAPAEPPGECSAPVCRIAPARAPKSCFTRSLPTGYGQEMTFMNVLFKRFALLLLVAGWAAAYPSLGSLDVTGASAFVGAFTISGPGQPTAAGYGGGFKGTINGAPNQHYIQMLFCVDFSN